VSSTGHIKLADFGTCVKMGDDGLVRCSSAVGTLFTQVSKSCHAKARRYSESVIGS
jgi:hypothetical protein